MSPAPTPVKIATSTLEVIFLTAVVWVLRGYVWPTLSSVEVAVLQARLDPSLFNGDFVVQESMRFTPRFYYNELILLFCRAGLPLAWSFVAWHLVALATLIAGLRSLGHSLGLGNVASAALVVWLLTVGVGAVGGSYFYTHAPVPGVWAAALVVVGAAYAARGRGVSAFAFFGAAALLQFLVGFYAGVLALPILWRITWRQRCAALAVWLLGLGLVYGPMSAGGATDSGALGPAEFVEIYAHIRHPHHLVASTWGWPVWVQAGMFYLGAWWLLKNKAAPARPKSDRVLLHSTLALAAAALLLGCLFVEIWPSAMVAKLQPARITPLAQAILLGLLALRLHERIAQKDFLGGTLLALIPFSPLPGFLLVVYAILLPTAQPKPSWQHLTIALAVLFAFQPLDPSFAARAVRYGLWAGIFGLQLLVAKLTLRPALLATAALSAMVGAGCCARASLDPRWPPFLAMRFSVDARPLDAPGILGQRFRRQAANDAVVLIPPGGDTWSFRLHSGRAAVVVEKDFPFTDRGIQEWKRRMEEVLSTPLAPGIDMTAAWRKIPAAKLATIAARFDTRYVLTRDDWHPQLPGRRIDQEQGWSLWELP